MDNARFTVLYCNHMSEFAGAEASLLELFKHVDRRQYRPVLACPGNGPLVEMARSLGVQVHSVNLFRLSFRALRSPLELLRQLVDFIPGILRLRRLLLDEHVDLVHVNSSVIFQPALAARLVGIPVVWHIREYAPSRWMRRVVAALIRRLANQIVVISRDVEQAVGGGKKVRVVYNGVDLREFETAQPAQDMAGPLKVGVFGQLTTVKGQLVLLQAIHSVVRNGFSLHCFVVGAATGPTQEEYRKQLEDFVRRNGLEANVSFLGYRQDVAALMKSMDVVVVPSLYEPFGRVVIEGMASQKAVVASRIGGIPEIVVHGETGILVPPGNVEALSSALEQVLRNTPLRDEMGRTGLARVVQAFSSTAYASSVMQVYREVLGA